MNEEITVTVLECKKCHGPLSPTNSVLSLNDSVRLDLGYSVYKQLVFFIRSEIIPIKFIGNSRVGYSEDKFYSDTVFDL